MDTLPDRRAPAFPDEPFSAYCKVCWRGVYCLWVDRNDHHRGECHEGATRIEDCREAMAWAEWVGEVKKYIASARSAAEKP